MIDGLHRIARLLGSADRLPRTGSGAERPRREARRMVRQAGEREGRDRPARSRRAGKARP